MAQRRKRQDDPSDLCWANNRRLIVYYYLTQGMTCEEVQRCLSEKYGFHATCRMFKTKFKAWGLPPKRINIDIYLAMERIVLHRRPAVTRFSVPKGTVRQIKNAEQVRKEVLRSKCTVLPNVEDAYSILARKKVEILVPPFSSNEQATTEQSTARTYSDLKFVHMNNPDQVLPLTEAVDPDVSIQEQERMGTADAVHESRLPILSSPTLSDSSFGTSATHHTAEFLPALAYTIPTLAELGMSPFVGQAEESGDSEGGRFDPLPIFTMLNEDSLLYSASGQLPPEFDDPLPFLAPSTHFERKRVAGEIVAPFYFVSEGFANPLNYRLYKRRAIQIFRQAIQRDGQSQYIFPCLNWMVTIFAYNGHTAQLEEFLQAFCKVIDEEEGETLTWGTPFHYRLAVLKNDADAIARHGAAFAKSHAETIRRFGPNSPNVLISAFYWIWHLLEQGESEAVIRLLQGCLPASAAIMGADDLLTINCLVMLSRAYSIVGESGHAINYLTEALQKFGAPKRPFKGFQLYIKWRIAKALMDTFKHAEAEVLLREVLQGQIEILGWLHKRTWFMVGALRDVLVSQGRSEEARTLWEEAVKCYEQAWEQAWDPARDAAETAPS